MPAEYSRDTVGSSPQRTLYLFNPRRRNRLHWDMKEACAIMGRATATHPLALPTLAALTPRDWTVRIFDEEIAAVDHSSLPPPTLVGVTSVVANVKRGYEVADHWRSRGVPVVMGGPQVTFHPDESLAHCDAVVRGEAEDIWAGLLADLGRGTLRKVYEAPQVCAFKTSPAPRWDLVNTRRIMGLGVQVSRGCPFRCDFCLVRNMFGSSQRYRDIDDVVAEIKSLPSRQITFVDDNLTGNKTYARELMSRLAPLRVSWSCQASIEVAYDEALLRAMADAGCRSILFGIESLNPASLAEGNKKHNDAAKYEEALARVHACGIHVIGSFVVGFDADTLDAYNQVLDFTRRNGISYIMLNILTAYPGTDLYGRMLKAGRLNIIDPDLLNGIYPTMRYMNISQTELFTTQFATLQKLFGYDVVREKALKVLGNGAFRRAPPAGVTVREKVLASWRLLRMFLLTTDSSKRRMFLSLVHLGTSGRASMGAVVEFLLMIASFRGYLAWLARQSPDVLAKIREADKGPWRDDPRSRQSEGALSQTHDPHA